MVNTQFGAILKELEVFFKCPLKPDQNDSCLIKMNDGNAIQIELDRYGQLIMGCRVGLLPMNRYRDNLIQQALKSNALTLLSTGIFGFSQKSNQLIIFIKIDTNRLTPHLLSSIVPPFLAKAKLWKDAIEKGEIPTLDTDNKSKAPSGLFGLLAK